MENKYCGACGLEVMQSLLMCPSCGDRQFSNEPFLRSPKQAEQVTGSVVKSGAISPNNGSVMTTARNALRGNWLLATMSAFIFFLVSMGSSLIPSIGPLIQVVVGGPLGIGWALFALKILRKEEISLSVIFMGFNGNYLFLSMAVAVLSVLFIFLWSILLLIPGIIAAMSYSMVHFVIVDNDFSSPLEALSKSKTIMLGHKWKLFTLMLVFLALSLVCIFTLGIGFLFLYPFIMVTMAAFYEAIK